MARTPDHPYMFRQGAVWHARVQIPADLRAAFDGKRVFMRTTKRSDPTAAYERAAPWIAEWLAEIDAARYAPRVRPASEVAAEFMRSTGTKMDIALLRDVTRYVAAQLGLKEPKWQSARLATGLDSVSAITEVPVGVDMLRAHTQPTTGLLNGDEIADWQARLLTRQDTKKSAYQYERNVIAFNTWRPMTIETIRPADLAEYVNARAKAGLAAVTIKRDLTGVKSYLAFLAETRPRIKGLWPEFEAVKAPPKSRYKKLDPTVKGFVVPIYGKDRLRDAQVPILWAEAHETGQIDARDCIIVQAYTGARRESVFDFHRNTVFLDDPVPWIFFNDKTESGVRGVPIHPDIMPLIRHRFNNPQPDGYLFRGGENKIDSRSARINNPMRDIFNACGITQPSLLTHGFRRLYIDMIEKARWPETLTAKLVGHKIKTMTYGLYASDEVPLADALDMMLQVIKFPSQPVF